MIEDMLLVGHGPSLFQRKMGDEIDNYRFVARVNPGLDVHGARAYTERPKAYGTRTDAVCFPLWRLVKGEYVKKNLLRPDVPELWISPSRRYRERHEPDFLADVGRVAERYPGRILHAFGAYHRWRKKYNEHETVYGDKRSPSTGIAAILIALENYKPEVLVLAGFDNAREGYPSRPNTMGDNSPHPPDIEHRILEEIEDTYNVELYHIP